MSNDITHDTTLVCPACGEDTPALTYRSWTHYDHDSSWSYDDGEHVTGNYCDLCVAEIDRITDAQADYEDSLTEPTIEDWAELACRLAMGLTRAFSNWQDVAHVTRREMNMLTEQMGEGWQRRW